MRRIRAGILAMISGRQAERLGVERRVALGLGAERVEAGGEVAVGAVGLDQRRRRLHRLQQLLVDRPGGAGAAAARRPRRAAAPAAGGGGAAGSAAPRSPNTRS